MKKLILFTFLAIQSIAFFAQATLLKDINLGNDSSAPSNKIIFNNEAYFAANNGVSGNELWKTDGTTLGTTMVKDIVAGAASGLYSELKGHVLGSELLFFEQTTFNDHNLWKTDGTEVGTVLVKTLVSGNILVHTVINGELLFSLGNELWKTDGTEVGTIKISNIAIFGNRYVKSGSTIYYSGNAADGKGNELYKTDGTSVGTVLVKDIYTGSNKNSYPTNFGVANGIVFFTAYTSTAGNELWKTDGTDVGTVMVKDITPGTTNTFTFENPKASFNNEFFIAFGTSLWKSDGTEIGTVEVKQVGSLKSLEVFNSKLVAFNFATTFWVSDGTTIGTFEITTEVDEFYHNSTRTVIGNELYFQGRNECFYQLWKTDGTELGTKLIKVINPEWDDNHIEHIVDLNGEALLTANDGTWHGRELWISDGTEGGTVMLKDINETGNQWSNPKEFFNYNGVVLFSADNGVNGRELWKTDGAITTMVKDINPGVLFGDPKNFVELNGTVYFMAITKTHGLELWKTDGTETGTERVTDINLDEENSLLSNGNIVVLNNKLYFYANDGINGLELWESDGTNGGTTSVKDINVGMDGSQYNGELIIYDNAIYFSAHEGSFDYELWKSDGTGSGTAKLKDLYVGGASYPNNFTLFNNKLYFTANVSGGNRLWMTDGSEVGTVIVSASANYPSNLVMAGSNLFFTSGDDLWKTDGVSTSAMSIGGYPGYLTEHAGVLYFRTNVGGVGYELWKTDGINSNMVKDIVPGSNKSSNITDIVSYGDNIYFGAGDNNQNKELWISDGTEGGTLLFQDINPSVEMFGNGSDPKTFHVSTNNLLFFVANDGTTNIEPWIFMDPSLSTKSFNESNQLTLFPNPVIDTFKIKTSNELIETIRVYTLLGREVIKINADSRENNVINISNLSSGIYIVKVKTDIAVRAIKIIKR